MASASACSVPAERREIRTIEPRREESDRAYACNTALDLLSCLLNVVAELERSIMDDNASLSVLVVLSDLLEEDCDDRKKDILPTVLAIATFRRKSIPRIADYVGLTNRYITEDFRKQFRIVPSTFETLLQYMGQVPGLVKPHEGRGRPPVPLEKQLLVTLRYLCTPETYSSLSEKFDLSQSTCSDIVKRVCLAFCQVQRNIIVWPSQGEHVWRVQREFQEVCGLYGILGAIDGCHIPIKPPADDEQSYFNRKQRHSVVLQGICDSSGKFTDVYAGWPGSVHDNRVLRNSPLFERTLADRQVVFPGNTFIIGDPAYSPRSWLAPTLKRSCQTNAAKKKYSATISKARVAIEVAFGHLKGRWRRLKFIDAEIRHIPNLIVACCVLHNICVMEKECAEDQIGDADGGEEGGGDDGQGEGEEDDSSNNSIDDDDRGDDVSGSDGDKDDDGDDDNDDDDDNDNDDDDDDDDEEEEEEEEEEVSIFGHLLPSQQGGQQLVDHLIGLAAALPPSN